MRRMGLVAALVVVGTYTLGGCDDGPSPGGSGTVGGAGSEAGAAGAGGSTSSAGASGSSGTAGAGGSGNAAGATSGGDPASPVFDAKPSGTYVTEAEACARITDAYKKLVGEKGCVYTGQPLECPAWLRVGQPSGNRCADYDAGFVTTCADVYLPELSCVQIASHPCSLLVKPIEDPSSCD